jgi:hypothetical protein
MPSTASGTLIPSQVPSEMQGNVAASVSPSSFSPSTPTAGAKKMKPSSVLIPFSLLWMTVAMHLALL